MVEPYGLIGGGVATTLALVGWVIRHGSRLSTAEADIKALNKAMDMHFASLRDMRVELLGSIRDLRASVQRIEDKLDRKADKQ